MRGAAYAVVPLSVATAFACGLSVTSSGGSTPLPDSDGGSTSSSSSSSSSGTSGVVGPRDDAGEDGGVPFDAGPDGCVDRALMLDGVDDLATVPDDNELDLPGDFTIEAWIKPAVTTGIASTVKEMHLISHHDHDTVKSGWVLLLKEGRLELRGYNAGGPETAGNDGPETILANKWSFVAGSYDGDSWRTFVNGVLTDVDTDAIVRVSPTGPVTIGRAMYATMFHYQGLIDEIRLSNTARYVGQSTPVPKERLPVDANTVALWRFDETTGTFANAVPGGKHVATPIGGATSVPAECINAR